MIMSIKVEDCSICFNRPAVVDIEVTNLTAQDVVALQACLICATEMTLRSWKTVSLDMDNLLYTALGTVGGSAELAN